MRTCKHNRLAAILAALSVSLPALSQNIEPVPDMSLEELLDTDVVSASRKTQNQQHVAAAVFVITQEDIARSGARDLPDVLAMAERPSMPAIYAALAADAGRNDQIFDDVLKSLEAKRSPIVLTERKDHLDYLHHRFSKFAKNLVVLRGGMSAKDRKAAAAALNVADHEERLILATGRYIGEGGGMCVSGI